LNTVDKRYLAEKMILVQMPGVNEGNKRLAPEAMVEKKVKVLQRKRLDYVLIRHAVRV
jgi:hypothetical protein